MRPLLAVFLVLFVLCAEILPALAVDCTCAAARATGGWCAVHQIGYIGGDAVRSKVVFDEMDAHGHKVDVSRFQCPSCERAVATDGYCAEHRIGFVSNLAYFSRLTYLLALGKPVEEAQLKCEVCRRNAASHGWCRTHHIGMAGHIAIEDPRAFKEVEHALGIMRLADEAAEHCLGCAVAIIGDMDCPVHRITYKDGKVVKGTAAP